jgi:phenylalanyl-tRNA synthetase beta chain
MLFREKELMTLDGTERDLTADMTVIADDEKALGIAGLMGGEHSEITDDTTDLIFESACFNGAAIRRASKALGLRTEASSRFEKALTPALCMTALKRALELIGMLDAGEVVGGIIDVDVSNYKPVTLPFQPEWVNGFIGIDCSAERQKQILESIGFTVKDGIITVPGFRNDISHKADISEEIARFYGYDNIPDRKLSGAANAALTDEQKFLKRADNLMRSYGLTEIFTYSFMSPKNYDKICLAKDSPERRCVTISNPLGEDTSVMRTTAIPSMLDILSRNYNYRNDSAALYETATVYIPKDSDTLPDEDKKLVIGMYGQQYDFFSLKGAVEQLLALEGITDYDVCAVTDDPTFHPGRTADVRKDGRLIARLGEIHPQVCRNFEIDTRAYCAQIDLKTVFDLRNEDRTYEPLPKFPAVTRDIALVCDASLPVLTLSRAIRKAAGKNVESVSLFDVYQGEQIEKGKKSVAFNLKLRSKEGTLTDEQCDAVMSKAVKAVESLGAVLRS